MIEQKIEEEQKDNLGVCIINAVRVRGNKDPSKI